MLTRDEIESFMEDADDFDTVHRAPAPVRSSSEAGTDILTMTTRAQLNMMRHWQRSMRGLF